MEDTLRVWTPFDSLETFNLQLWMSIDMKQSGKVRGSFILDNKDVSRAIESSVARNEQETDDVRRMIDIGSRAPVLVVVLLSDGKTAIYSVDNLNNSGSRRVKLAKVELIVRKNVIKSEHSVDRPSRLWAYAAPMALFNQTVTSSSDLTILCHEYDQGVVYHYTVDFEKFLSNSECEWSLREMITGHNKSIQNIIRSPDGECLLSQSRFKENILWRHYQTRQNTVLKRTTMLEGKIVKSTLASRGEFIVTLLEKETTDFELVLWDCRSQPKARALTRINVDSNEIPICFFFLPESNHDEFQALHLISMYNRTRILVYEISIKQTSIQLLGSFELPIQDELYLAIAVDPVGWQARIEGGQGGRLDFYQRDVLITISKSGLLRTWTASLTVDCLLEWLETSMVETGYEDVMRAQASSTKKVVIANDQGTKLSIWDTRNNLLEFQEKFELKISDLDWTSSPTNQSVLGIGFEQQVVLLYCQLRFDYTNETPAWAPFRKIDISQYTLHAIGDSIWLKNGMFVIGSGNQLFIQDEKMDMDDEITRNLLGSTRSVNEQGMSIFDVCAILNGPLPIYHPQLLIQSIFAGKLTVVKRILEELLHQLKFAAILDERTEIVDIKSDLGLDSDVLITIVNENQLNGDRQKIFRRKSISERGFDENVCHQLGEWIQKVSLPYLTRHQQITLASVIEAVGQTEIFHRSIDENGMKYMLGYKLFKIHRGTQESMTIRDFNWALHSESQDVILRLIEIQQQQMLWPQVREVGIPYWLNLEKLKEVFENLGRNYFSLDEKRDPLKCTIYYLALRKKQILLRLWRTAGWHPEQAKTIKLLSNDFEQRRWKSAALKNAFALLGKHRYEYAASFFLLADSLQDSVNVIIRNIRDISLAIAVARVYEGSDNGPVLNSIIENHILPQARKAQGDRWAISWAYWIRGLKQEALQALCEEQTKSFLVDDPVLAILYKGLRDKSLRTSTSFRPVSSEQEFSFVLRTASIYCRMGCDILALDLIKNWQFLRDTPTITEDGNKQKNQNISAEYSINDSIQEKKLKPAAAIAFQEPDMSAFGF